MGESVTRLKKKFNHLSCACPGHYQGQTNKMSSSITLRGAQLLYVKLCMLLPVALYSIFSSRDQIISQL